jgi:hypothetical protein
MILELAIALGLASCACCALFVIQGMIEERQLTKMKKEIDDLYELES